MYVSWSKHIGFRVLGLFAVSSLFFQDLRSKGLPERMQWQRCVPEWEVPLLFELYWRFLFSGDFSWLCKSQGAEYLHREQQRQLYVRQLLEWVRRLRVVSKQMRLMRLVWLSGLYWSEFAEHRWQLLMMFEYFNLNNRYQRDSYSSLRYFLLKTYGSSLKYFCCNSIALRPYFSAASRYF